MRKVGFFSASGVLVLALSAPGVANAQFFPGGGGVMADPIATAVSNALRASSSFLSLDSVMQSTTLKAISDEAVAIARGASTYVWNGVTGISWATVAKSAGRTTLAGVAVGLAVDGLAKWYFADDEVSTPTTDDEVRYVLPTWADVPTSNPPKDTSGAYVPWEMTGELEPGGPGYTCNSGSPLYSNIYGTTYESVRDECLAAAGVALSDCIDGVNSYWNSSSYGSLKFTCTFPDPNYGNNPLYTKFVSVNFVPQSNPSYGSSGLPASVSCPGGQMWVDGSCRNDPSPAPYGDVVNGWAGASDGVPYPDLGKPVNPTIIAGIANGLWDHVSSQPGYQGAPYVPGAGVSSGDASAGMSQSGQVPTVNDLVRPIDPSLPGSFEVPGVTVPPGTIDPPYPGDGTGTTPPPVDLGPDPGIGAPELDGIPTAQMIVDPLKGLFPSLQNFQVSLPAGECPTASFEVFGETYVMASHCDLIEEQEGNIRAAILAAFAVLSLLIVLRA